MISPSAAALATGSAAAVAGARKPMPMALRIALRLGLTGLLLSLILLAVPLHEVVEAARAASLRPLLGGFALGFLFAALKIVRWRWLLVRMGVACGMLEATRSYFGGMAVGLITPGRLGEVARGMYIDYRDKTYAGSVAFVDKLFDIAVLVVAAAAGWALYGFYEIAVLMFLGAAGLVACLFLPSRIVTSVARRLPVRGIRVHLEKAAAPLDRATLSTVSGALIQAVLSFLVAATQFWLFLLAFGPAPLGAAFLAMPMIVLANLIPITISGIGVREWAAIVLLSQYSVPGAVAVSVAMLGFVSNTLGPGITGALLAPRWKRLPTGLAVEASR
ncbi:MAG: lysylphosphatidylglycerol synthase transmembrane domain-containing protein [Acidobacteriota bacterium]